MSKTIAKAIASFASLVTAHMSPQRRASTKALAAGQLTQTIRVPTGRGDMFVFCPSARALHDPQGFGKDEPETISWIDQHIEPGETLWDIGANIGLYTLYAALHPQVTVLAFEPSASSFATLVRNLELNTMGDRVAAYCLAFSDTTKLDALHMANTESGHSMHAFGQTETVEGPVDTHFSQAVMGFSVDGFRDHFGLSAPDHIKLDVDSIEIKILKGAAKTLPHVRTVMVETYGTDRPDGSNEIADLLDTAGFRLSDATPPGQGRNQLFLNSALAPISAV